MALKYAGIAFEQREIELKNKPRSMLLASPKGTVPVLCIDGMVIDQSINIMHWALDLSDPDDWLNVDPESSRLWIEKNDGLFKKLLDQYKYPSRYPDIKSGESFNAAIECMLIPMEERLQSTTHLMGNKITWVDVAIFPFIRQFSMVDPVKFEALPLLAIKKWLKRNIESELFQSIMNKHPVWVGS